VYNGPETGKAPKTANLKGLNNSKGDNHASEAGYKRGAPVMKTVQQLNSTVKKDRSRHTAKDEALFDHSLSLGAKAVYQALDSYAWTSPECCPREATIASRLNKSVRSVERWMSELKKRGYIRVDRTVHGNSYVLLRRMGPTLAKSVENSDSVTRQYGPQIV
jgi:Helix-turn-helix domain